MTQAIFALIAALCGGLVVKVVEWFLNRSSVNFNEGLSLRQELRKDIERLSREVIELRRQNDEWRSKYWDLVKVNGDQYRKIDILEQQVKELHTQLQEYVSKDKK